MAKLTKEQKDEWAISKGYKDFADYHKKWREKNKKHLKTYKIKWRENSGYAREMDYRNALASDLNYKSYYFLLRARRQEKGLEIKPKIPKGYKDNHAYLENLAERQEYPSYTKKR